MIVVPWTREVAMDSDAWCELGYILRVEPTRILDELNILNEGQGSRSKMTSSFLLFKTDLGG